MRPIVHVFTYADDAMLNVTKETLGKPYTDKELYGLRTYKNVNKSIYQNMNRMMLLCPSSSSFFSASEHIKRFLNNAPSRV